MCGKHVLHTDVRRTLWNDIDVGLTIGEYNIVHLLASNVGRWITYRTAPSAPRRSSSASTFERVPGGFPAGLPDWPGLNRLP